MQETNPTSSAKHAVRMRRYYFIALVILMAPTGVRGSDSRAGGDRDRLLAPHSYDCALRDILGSVRRSRQRQASYHVRFEVDVLDLSGRVSHLLRMVARRPWRAVLLGIRGYSPFCNGCRAPHHRVCAGSPILNSMVDKTVLAYIEAEYRRYKALADAAISQLSEADLGQPGPGGGNSVAVLAQHRGEVSIIWLTSILTPLGRPSFDAPGKGHPD